MVYSEDTLARHVSPLYRILMVYSEDTLARHVSPLYHILMVYRKTCVNTGEQIIRTTLAMQTEVAENVCGKTVSLNSTLPSTLLAQAETLCHLIPLYPTHCWRRLRHSVTLPSTLLAQAETLTPYVSIMSFGSTLAFIPIQYTFRRQYHTRIMHW